MNDMSSVPVLLLGFNRPSLLQDLIDSLRPISPERVYLVVDGPRDEVPADREATLECQQAANRIDWRCELTTLFRTENRGCALGVSEAITWFFEREEAGIILEDDVRVHPTFFPFCQTLLERYRTDERVTAVSGCNFVPSRLLDPSSDYRFTRITHVWGWATWRRAWRDYRHDISHWRRQLTLLRLSQACQHAPESLIFWVLIFELVSRGVIDSWAYRFIFTAFRTGGLTATANTNLVSNVGTGVAATHTKTLPGKLTPPKTLSPPYRGPQGFCVDEVAEHWVMRNVMGATVHGLCKQGSRFAGRQFMTTLKKTRRAIRSAGRRKS